MFLFLYHIEICKFVTGKKSLIIPMGIPILRWGWRWRQIFITRWVWGRVWRCRQSFGDGDGKYDPRYTRPRCHPYISSCVNIIPFLAWASPTISLAHHINPLPVTSLATVSPLNNYHTDLWRHLQHLNIPSPYSFCQIKCIPFQFITETYVNCYCRITLSME